MTIDSPPPRMQLEPIRCVCYIRRLISSLTYLFIQTVGVLHTFFLAMTLYPSVQARAHAEIDNILEGKALPTFKDEPNLPYVKALCMELIRWRPITPVAIPHVNTEADVYGKYYIPKGSLVGDNSEDRELTSVRS